MGQVSGGKSRRDHGLRAAFWAFAGVGVLALTVAWVWFGLALLEEATEQSKAEAAGTTMAGFAATFGGIPLALAHLTGIALLSVLGWLTWRGAGLAYAVLVVAAASLVGLGAAQLLFGGNLFYTAPVFVP